VDSDGDGYGNKDVRTQSCTQPLGYVADDTDCNDSNSKINPAAVESCNELDDDCNDLIDDVSSSDMQFWYEDSDGDGYGNKWQCCRYEVLV